MPPRRPRRFRRILVAVGLIGLLGLATTAASAASGATSAGGTLTTAQRATLLGYAKDTWAGFVAMTDEKSVLPADSLKADGTPLPPKERASLYMVRKFPDGWRINLLLGMNPTARLNCSSYTD